MTPGQGESREHRSDANITAQQVGPWTVVTVMTGSPWRANCYIVIEERSREGVIVDPGDRGDLILSEARRRGVLVRHVLLTHGHHDHVGAVTSVCEAFDVGCMVNEEDARLVRQAPLYAFRFSGIKLATPRRVECFPTDELVIGDHTVLIHHAPGHTRGGVVFEFPGFALTGDTLLHERVGRTDLPGGDATTLRGTIDTLLRGLQPNTLLFAGHGSHWTVAEAREWWRMACDAPAQLNTFAAEDA